MQFLNIYLHFYKTPNNNINNNINYKITGITEQTLSHSAV